MLAAPNIDLCRIQAQKARLRSSVAKYVVKIDVSRQGSKIGTPRGENEVRNLILR